MAIPLTINGVTFQYPQQFDKNWGPTLTNWSSAVTTGMLQKAGGTFTLTAEVDFGASFGIKALSLKSEESNIASTGILRLANASSGVVWRNALNNADLPLTVNASNQLTFNGTSIGATTSLTNSHILVGNVSNQPADVTMSGDITITNAGVTTLGAGKVLDANINASAAITLSKLAATTAYYWYVANSSGVLTPLGVTASKVVITDANGLPSASTVTPTTLAFLDATSSVQTQIDGKVAKSGDTMSGALSMGSHKITSVTQGANTGEAISFPVGTSEISASAITTALIAANAVTHVVNAGTSDIYGFGGTTLDTVTITTTGGPVLIIASASISCVPSTGTVNVRLNVTEDGAGLNGSDVESSQSGYGSNPTIPLAIVTVSTPAAGSHTYLTKCTFNSGGSFSSAPRHSLVVIELKR